MINPKDYARDEVIRLLLQSPPGYGKSMLACQMPKPRFIDIDRNLGGALRELRKRNMPLPVGIDFIDRDEKDQLIPMPLRFNKLNQVLIECQNDPNTETIVLDSGTTLADVLIAEVLRSQGKSAISDFKDGRQFWNFFAIAGRHLMATLSQIRKNIVLIAHEKTETDDLGKVVYPIKVAWPGQVGEIIGCFFTNVWRCERDMVAAGQSNTYKWMVRTLPNKQYALKNTLGVPELFEFKWEIVAKALAS